MSAQLGIDGQVQPDRVCGFDDCKAPLGSGRPNQRYCSDACKSAAYRDRKACQSRQFWHGVAAINHRATNRRAA